MNDLEYLKSRIDQQSDLICILKKRADEYLGQYVKLEHEVKTVKEEKTNLVHELKLEKEKSNLIEKRLLNVSNTNVHINETSDQLKVSNQDLLKTIEILKSEILSHKCQISEQTEKIKELEETYNLNTQSSTLLKKSHIGKLNKVRCEISQMKIFIEKAITVYKSDMNLMSTDFKLLRNNIQGNFSDFSDLTNKNSALTKRVQDTEKQLGIFKEKYNLSQVKICEYEEKLTKKNLMVSKNELVLSLQGRIDELEYELNSSVTHFDAYKSHSSDLLKRERDINLQLRRLKKSDSVQLDEK